MTWLKFSAAQSPRLGSPNGVGGLHPLLHLTSLFILCAGVAVLSQGNRTGLLLSGVQPRANGDEAFRVLERFPGVDANGPSGFAPLAVGPGHVVLFGHSHVTLFRKASGNSTASQLAKVPVGTFFANPIPPGPVDRLTDQDVIFDPEAGRFFMALADTTALRLQLLIAVSKTSLPETLSERDWYIYRLDRNDAGVDEADFDHLAIAGDRLLVSWQRTKRTSIGPLGLGTTIRVFDKRPFMQGSLPLTAPIDLVLPSDRNLRARPASVTAARDRAPDRVFYDIASQCAGGRMSWLLGVVSGLPAAPVLTTREVVSPLPCVNNAVSAPQPGSAGLPLRRRLAANPSYRDGRLWVFEWGDGNAAGTTSGIQWVEIDVRGWPDNVTVVQAGVHREPGVWLFAPAGIVDVAGNLVLTYGRSGPSEYPSSGLGGRLATDPPGTTRQGETLRQGQRVWEEPTDDLAVVLGAATDPVDGSVWVSGITPATSRPPGNKDSSAAWIGRLRPLGFTPNVATVPGAPSGLVTSSSGPSVTLVWNLPTTGGTPTAYVIEAGSSSGAADLANFSTGTTTTSFSASGVSAGTYFVRVKAVNSAGMSAGSNEATLVVGRGCAPPGAPGGLTAASVGGGTVVLSWIAAAGSPTSYIVEAGSTPGASNLANNDLGGPATSLTATGVSAGTYFVRLRAKNACGASATSNEITLIVS